MSDLETLEAIRTTVASVAHHIDAKRWDDLRALYADEVAIDYTSLFGGEAQQQPGDALIAAWRGALAKVATHHLLGPIGVAVDGDRASARCHVRAMHHAPGAPSGASWDVLGHYRFSLAHTADGWKITEMTIDTMMQIGNRALLAEAAK